MSNVSSLNTVLSNVNNAFSGKSYGIDVASTVEALMTVERAPETAMKNQQDAITTKIGLLNSISTDLTALYISVNDLKDVFGPLGQKDANSSNTAIVTATASNSAAIGDHTIVVSKLAQTSSTYSDPIPSAASLSSTEIDIAYGDAANPTKTDKITLPSGLTTLQQAADAINNSANNTGVRASVVTDSSGSRLVVVSKNSGVAGNLTVTGAVDFAQGSAGIDASLTVDGVPASSASNTVTGVLSGVTLNLAVAAPDTPVQLTIANDASQAATTLNNFVTAYNTVIKDINKQYTADSSGSEGPLAGDSSLRTLQSQLMTAVTYSANGTGQYVNLQSLGVQMQNDGTLQIDSATVTDTLTNHFADFQNFFQSASPVGFGQNMGKMLLSATDPTEGVIGLDIQGLQNTSKSISRQISDFEQRMAMVQQHLNSQYSILNVLLQQYSAQVAQVNSQLSALNPNNSNS